MIWKCQVAALTLQTDEATAIHTEAEMQQASDAMREALKGDSAASAALTDMDVDAAKEMVHTLCIWSKQLSSCLLSHAQAPDVQVPLLDQRQSIVLQVPPAVNIELRQQLEDMGFSANK